MGLLEELEEYYGSKGISPSKFHCRHAKNCGGGHEGFTPGLQAFVGTEYEKRTLPRVLFLSLDSGKAPEDADSKSMSAIRDWEENHVVVKDLLQHKLRHWYETHEVAHKILSKFNPDLELQEVKPHFAHTTSAKCCLNLPQKQQASDALFKNCREFIPLELEILAPDILITQGNAASAAIEKGFVEANKGMAPQSNRPDCPAHTLPINGRSVIWFPMYHPSARYGLYTKQKQSCLGYWADLAYRFVEDNR
jgi:hypothetical protein